MSQDNQFHQYGYDHYLKAPTRPVSKGRSVSGMRGGILNKVQNPVVATVALVAAAALFVGVIVMTYPSDDDAQKQIPIIKADLRPIKTLPEDRGGMSIPHRESTILARSSQPEMLEGRGIENLFARTSEDLVTKEQAIERAMAAHPMEQSIAAQTRNIPVLLQEDGVSQNRQDQEWIVSTHVPVIDEHRGVAVKNVDDLVPAFELKEPTAKDILQKIGSSGKDSNLDDAGLSAKVVSVVMSSKPKRAQMHAAATSPETLAFVRNILNAKAQKMHADPSATDVAAIKPALGAQINITSGSYFVQLASITEAARAGKEWSKMQARYDVLATSKFRVQEAVLSRGTFYRIQAGPMSKSSANAVCDALKQANKPGGCLVVK